MKFFLTLIILLLSICISAQDVLSSSTGTELASTDTISIMEELDALENLELPPLSIFLESIYDHPSIKIYEARRDEEKAILKETQLKWLNFFRATGTYQYGQVTGLTKTETDELMYAFSSRAQHQYNAGITVSIPFGDLIIQKQKNKAQKSRLDQIQYEYEISIEERKLKILEAYNLVVKELSTLKVKADAVALYNAQMKISEQDFINGKIDIISLSLERSRRTSAAVTYQEGKASLHNSITLLEMLTNIKVISR
ncbi:TolC family protein [Parabacteroides sp. AM08-6]|uniref:TolC family protein n=1 Tax=Parabacteroides sp. AM08-6 TaxID=2292053 RepID=UPI000EFE0379|nr:TolC family protein [Parabacteroides sp. AM08-6]RHJ87933.1 transporter [Parabacteroides sp. AM08-6]